MKMTYCVVICHRALQNQPAGGEAEVLHHDVRVVCGHVSPLPRFAVWANNDVAKCSSWWCPLALGGRVRGVGAFPAKIVTRLAFRPGQQRWLN